MGRFEDILSGLDEIEITFVRRKDGKPRTIPIWFTVERGMLELLPMYGLKTQWFLDIESSGSLDVSAKGQKLHAQPRMIRDRSKVEQVKKRFGQKYGESEVQKYYPTSDVAMEITL